MTVIIPDGFIQIVFNLRLDNDVDPMCITMAGSYGDPINTGLADAIQTNTETNWENMLGIGYHMTSVVVRTEEKASESTLGEIDGTGSAAMCPPNTAYLVKKNTALRGRENQGRFYLPGVAESSVDSNGNLSSGTISGLGGELEDFRENVVSALGSGETIVILHSTSADPTPVQNFVLQPVVATQRRRLR